MQAERETKKIDRKLDPYIFVKTHLPLNKKEENENQNNVLLPTISLATPRCVGVILMLLTTPQSSMLPLQIQGPSLEHNSYVFHTHIFQKRRRLGATMKR